MNFSAILDIVNAVVHYFYSPLATFSVFFRISLQNLMASIFTSTCLIITDPKKNDYDYLVLSAV